MFTLHIAIVDTQDGYKSFYGLSETDLRKKLAEYCREQWEEEELGMPESEEDEDLIDEFFDQMSFQTSYRTASLAISEIDILLKAAQQIFVDAANNQNSGLVEVFENHWQALSDSLREIEKHNLPTAWLPNKENNPS